MGVVYLIGPESDTYHVQRACPALNSPTRYGPVERGRLLPDGNVLVTGLSSSLYRGRRRCKRCGGEA